MDERDNKGRFKPDNAVAKGHKHGRRRLEGRFIQDFYDVGQQHGRKSSNVVRGRHGMGRGRPRLSWHLLRWAFEQEDR